MLYYEKKFKKQGKDYIVGIDEVGRGPLAGPVVAAAVMLKNSRFKSRIDDSKKLSPKQREQAFLEIINKSVFGIGIINEKIIDRLNILVATEIAMENAVSELIVKMKRFRKSTMHAIIDGTVKPKIKINFTNIIKGDAKSKSIACASILAKVTRDRIMDLYHKAYPQYGFNKHKGYPTKEHRDAIKENGPCLIHRTSFYCG